MSNVFFIADTHFNDNKIIQYCNRPFKCERDQQEALINNWNRVVSDDDDVWVLGDYYRFTESSKSSLSDLCIQRDNCSFITQHLSGHKHLILGNHDTMNEEFYCSIGFKLVSPYPVILNKFFMLSHEPLQLSETTPFFNLYGHVHNDAKYVNTKTSRCVSVERINYTPISLEEILSDVSD